jgi:hypothetical protein
VITQYFRSITAGANTVLADTNGSDLLLIAGTNISLAANAALGQLTIGISPGASFPVPITQDNSTNATNYVVFNNASSGDLTPRTDTDFYYNPATGILAVSGIRFGDATIASTASQALAIANFNFKIAGDDSTQRTISLNETVKFVGAGGITTASDAEGNITITATSTPTITGGSITGARINPRAVAAGSTSGTLTPNGDTTDVFNAFGLTGAITVGTPSGTPVDGQRLILRFEDNGSGRGITWTTSSGAYRAVGATLPTTTVASKVTYVGCVYNSTDVFWDAIAVATQA